MSVALYESMSIVNTHDFTAEHTHLDKSFDGEKRRRALEN